MFNWSVLQRKMRYAYNKVLPALHNTGYIAKANKIADCGHYKELAVCQDCGETYLNGFNSCKDRFCPICEKKRSYLWLAKLSPILERYLKENKKVNMLTLTIVDEPNLKSMLEILTKCWRILIHEDKTMRKEFNKRFIGGFRALEVKRGKNSGLWHCHYHCLVIKDCFSEDFEWLKTSWQKAYRLVTGKDVSLELRIESIKKNAKGYLGGILEVAKYVTKFDWSLENDVKELITSLTNVRTTSTWGCLRKDLTEKSIEDDMDLTLDETIKLVCRSCGSNSFDILEGITGNNYSVSDYGEIEDDTKK